MAVKSVTVSDVRREMESLAAAARQRAGALLSYLRANNERLLVGLLIVLVVSSMFSCMVIYSLGASQLADDGGGSAGGLTPYQATATYGAEIFHQQLTLQAKQK